LAICDVVLFGSKMNFHDDISGGKDKKSFIQSIFCSCNGFRIAGFLDVRCKGRIGLAGSYFLVSFFENNSETESGVCLFFLKPGPSGFYTIMTDVSKGQDMVKAGL
jgi:hypothetical protein